ncbi:hypothetical protein DL770_000297 [Monosporascus sp. CRB-9-2]|nr:hypothetical protein DL770_000297 [Monosporascus sp. CRB-9-2]
MRPPAPALDVIAARRQSGAVNASGSSDSAPALDGASITVNRNQPVIMISESSRDSRSSSSTNSPAPDDKEESDFFLGANDSQSSLGVVPNMQDMQVSDQECLPTVAALPSEILISIFSRLSETKHLLSCMLVCKKWARNIVEILWHRPTCAPFKKLSSICYTLSLENPYFAYAEFIKRLNLAALADQVNDGTIMPLSVCPRVERMTLTNCKNLTDSGLIPLVRNNHHLLALDISGDQHITEATITAIAESCRRLQGLNISGCQQISNESLIQLAKSCRYIKRLKLNDCVQVNDGAVLSFAESCPNMLEIDLHQCKNVGNEPVTSLLVKGQSLRELRLAGCDLIDDSAFLSLPSNRIFEHLRILDLTSCARLTDRAVERIIDVAPRLRNLVLAKCANITDVAVYAIARLGRNLHYVHLGHCRHITDDGVKQLVQCCNRIRYIDLGCCSHLTDESVTRLATLPKLKRIGLVKCTSITDESIYALARANHRGRVRRDAAGNMHHEGHTSSSLERVHLSYCVNLGLKSIIKLLNSCPKLTHLSLTGVTAFLREDLETFCRDAPLEFSEHQRSVFCVFSGAGVVGLRRYFNSRPEFAGLLELPRSSRRRSTVAHGVGTTTPGPLLDMDGIDDGDGIDDDDMGDGSEIALDHGDFQQPVNDDNGTAFNQIPPPPPPPPQHQPPTTTGIAQSHSAPPQPSSLPNPTFPGYGGAVAPPSTSGSASSTPSNGQGTPAGPQASLEQVITATPAPITAPGAAAPSMAGASIFGNTASGAGPSTASLQGPAQDGGQNDDTT